MISMDINTALIMLAVFVLIYIALFAGYETGKKHGALYGITETPPIFTQKILHTKKDESFHERDPWNELRVDIPGKAQVIQTLGEEDRP